MQNDVVNTLLISIAAVENLMLTKLKYRRGICPKFLIGNTCGCYYKNSQKPNQQTLKMQVSICMQGVWSLIKILKTY
jgi:hypothetical protein